MEAYATIYFGAAVLAMCLVPIVSQFGKRWCLLEVHGLNVDRQKLIPRIGGIAIVIATMAVILTAMFGYRAIGQSFHEVNTDFIVLLIVGSLVFVLGLIDDLFSLSGNFKLMCLVVASLVICISGTTLSAISVGDLFVIKTGLAAWPLTVIWIVMITICMSIVDGLDGLAGGIAAIVCGTISLMAILSSQTMMAILMLALLGSLTGFLFFNWHPAKVFMGKSGLMFLGFMIGAGSLVCQTKTYTLIGLMLPVFALGVPILDTVVSIMRRCIFERQSISTSDRHHLYSRLLTLGFTPRVVVLIFYALTTLSASVGVFLLTSRSGWPIVVSVASLIFVYFLFLYLLRRREVNTLQVLKHNLAIARESRALQQNFKHAKVCMLDARSFNTWWKAVCTLGIEMRFQSIALSNHHGGDDSITCVWTAPDCTYTTGRTAKMSFPLGVDGADGWEIMASIWVDKCLELGGQQAMLLARLLDEFPMPNLNPTERDEPGLLDHGKAGQHDTMSQADVGSQDRDITMTTAHTSMRACIPSPLHIVGIPVTPFKTYTQALTCIENAVASNHKWFCAAINPIKIYNAWHDPELKRLLRQVDIMICDGMGVAKASQILYGQKIERITGCDLFFELLMLAARKQWGVFLLGASAHANSGARMSLEAMYPGLKIVGNQDGYFTDSNDVVRQINASGAKLLFVAMGSPKQEQWICRHRQAIDANFCMGVGGSFDVAAGSVKRAPRLFQMTGTEFLFRFALEPRKRFSQQKILLNFMTRVILTRLSAPRDPIPTQEGQHN